MKADKKTVRLTLKKLKQRQWLIGTNGSYNTVNPTLVINNEINNINGQSQHRTAQETDQQPPAKDGDSHQPGVNDG